MKECLLGRFVISKLYYVGFLTVFCIIPVHFVQSDFLQHITLTQSLQREIVSTEVKQKLSDISTKWADLAQKIALWKAKEVMEITKEAQEAQILSLRIGSISTRLKSAVSSAQNVFDSAFERYKVLDKFAKDAETYSVAMSIVLDLLRYIHTVREKWAKDERERALRLSTYLQSILYDLKEASKSSQDAHEYAMMTKQFKYYQKR